MRRGPCAMLVLLLAGCGEDPVEEPAGDQLPPQRTMHWPASDAVVDTASPMIIVAFDEAIDPGSIGDGTLEVFGSSPVAVPVSRTVAATTVAVAPTQPLAPGEYRARLAAGVADLAGNATATSFEWSFTVPDRGDHQAPRIVFVDPPDGATGVALDTSVSVFFDEVLDDATIAGSVSLRDASGTLVASTISSLTTGVLVVPSADLASAEGHTATAAATLADLSGNILGAPHTWSFETRTITPWESAVELESMDEAAGLIDIAVGGDHDVVVTWIQETGKRYDVWAARRTIAGWGPRMLVETADPGSSGSPEIAMDDTGTATAVWVHAGTVRELRTSRQLPGGAWEPEEVLSQAVLGHPHAAPKLAVNRTTGAAVVVWPPSNFEAGWRVRRFTVGTGWAPVETVNQFNASAWLAYPQIALAVNGDVVLVWNEYEGGADRPTAAVRTGAGWGAAIRLGTPQAIANEPRLAMNASGQAIVVWNQVGSPWEVWAQTWSAASGWGTAVAIDQSDEDSESAEVAVSADGSAIVSWTEWPASTPRAHAARWTQATGWQAPVLVDDHPEGTHYPALAIGDDGAAVLAWTRRPTGQPHTVWAARYTPATGWLRADPIVGGAGYVTEGSLVAAIGRDDAATLAWAARVVDSMWADIFSSRLP